MNVSVKLDSPFENKAFVVLNLDEQKLNKISQHIFYLIDNPELQQIKIPFNDFTINGEKSDYSEYKNGFLFLYNNSIYFNVSSNLSNIVTLESVDFIHQLSIPNKIEDIPTSITREQIMEFWRSDAMSDTLTVDDRMEIFLESPIGASDITVEVLNDLLDDYSVEDVKVSKIENHKLVVILGKAAVKDYNSGVAIEDLEDKPQIFTFDTTAELEAFKKGMSCAMGWENYELVENR